MLMKLCKLSRRWFSAAGDTMCTWNHSFHLGIGSTGSIRRMGQLYRYLNWPLHGLLVHAAFPDA